MKHDIVYADYGAEWTHKKEIKIMVKSTLFSRYSMYSFDKSITETETLISACNGKCKKEN